MTSVLRARAHVVAQRASVLVLQPAPQAGCAACEGGRGCGVALWSRLAPARDAKLELPYAGPQREVGDIVWLELEQRELLRMAALVWGVPLSSLLGIAAIWALFPPLWASVLSLVLALATCLMYWVAHTRLRHPMPTVLEQSQLPADLMSEQRSGEQSCR